LGAVAVGVRELERGMHAPPQSRRAGCD
jgi:hypothetical protein